MINVYRIVRKTKRSLLKKLRKTFNQLRGKISRKLYCLMNSNSTKRFSPLSKNCNLLPQNVAIKLGFMGEMESWFSLIAGRRDVDPYNDFGNLLVV